MKKIVDTDDVEELVSEFAVPPFEKILQKHFVHGSGSGLRIKALLAAEIYISKYDFAYVLRK